MNGPRLDAASSILASANRSIPRLDETAPTDCCIDVVDVQNVNLIPLIVTFASVNQRRAIFPTSPSWANADVHRPIAEPHFLTELRGLGARSEPGSTSVPPPQERAPPSLPKKAFSSGQRAADAIGPSKSSAGVSKCHGIGSR